MKLYDSQMQMHEMYNLQSVLLRNGLIQASVATSCIILKLDTIFNFSMHSLCQLLLRVSFQSLDAVGWWTISQPSSDTEVA